MADEEAESEAAKTTLRVELGGTPRRVPRLPIRAADAWIEQLQTALAETGAGVQEAIDLDTASGVLLDLSRKVTHKALDLVIAYDRDGTLPNRDWILDHAFPEEIAAALETMRVAALPFGAAVLSMTDVFRMAAEAIVAGQLSSPSNTNGHSPTGGLPQDHLKPRSRTRSSTSSGKKARSA